MDNFYLYIIYSTSINKYYVGHSNNLPERLKKHNSNHKGYTGKANDWVIVYSEIHNSKESAYRREREIKDWKSRILIEKLIKENSGSEHPD